MDAEPQDAGTQARIDALEEELRVAIENLVVGAVEEGVARERARQYIEDAVARLNGRSREERCAVAWGLLVREPRLPSMLYALKQVEEARFYLGRDLEDGAPFLGVNVRLRRPIEEIKISFALAPSVEPLCKVCGCTRGDPVANHRGSQPGFPGPVNEDGYYPHSFEARADGD